MSKSEVKAKEKEQAAASELDELIWSVISFERCEASSLSYSEAIAKVSELESKKIPGLCVVTEEAGHRISSS